MFFLGVLGYHSTALSTPNRCQMCPAPVRGAVPVHGPALVHSPAWRMKAGRVSPHVTPKGGRLPSFTAPPDWEDGPAYGLKLLISQPATTRWHYIISCIRPMKVMFGPFFHMSSPANHHLREIVVTFSDLDLSMICCWSVVHATSWWFLLSDPDPQVHFCFSS